jgi:hypothetical protein
MRHWIIANGKSLLDTPLDLLKDEITWGMNRIHLHYKNTDWRPTYFLLIDFNQQNKPIDYWKDCIRAHWETPKYLWDGFRSGDQGYPDLGDGIGEVPNTTWIPRCKRHHYYQGDNYRKRAESWHFPEICTAFSGIGSMMQLAVLNGATELYIVGADLYVPDYRANFFTPDYTDDQRPRDKMDNENMNQAHMVARRSSPVPIYNATLGGKLEVHPRVDFFEVLNGEKEKVYRPGA